MTLTGRTPEIASAHAGALFYEVMEFFSAGGLIDYTDEAARGGEYSYRPRVGQLASKPMERANVASLSDSATVRSTTYKGEDGVVLRRTKLHEFYDYESLVAGIDQGWYDDEIGHQLAIMAGQTALVDLYNAAIGAAQFATIDHYLDLFVDTATAGDQVDLSIAQIQNAKYKMLDHQETLDWGVLHSKVWNDIRQDILTDSNYVVPNIVGDLVRGQLYRTLLGVTFIVDNQVPTNISSPSNATEYQTLLFRSAGMDPHGRAPLRFSLQRPLELVRQHVLGAQSTKRQMQTFADWMVAVNGACYDISGGGANPAAATLRSSGSWDATTQDDARMCGTVLVSSN